MSSLVNAQDLVFEKGWNNSNYDVNLLGITEFDNIVIKSGATVLIKNADINVKNNVYQQPNSIVHLQASIVTYANRSNSPSKFVVRRRGYTTLNVNINLSDYKGEIVVRKRGAAVLVGKFNEIKNIKIEQGIYDISSGGRVIINNFLIR